MSSINPFLVPSASGKNLLFLEPNQTDAKQIVLPLIDKHVVQPQLGDNCDDLKILNFLPIAIRHPGKSHTATGLLLGAGCPFPFLA
jgi:hypothetical protein